VYDQILIYTSLKPNMVFHSPEHAKRTGHNTKRNIFHQCATYNFNKLNNIIGRGEMHTRKNLLHRRLDLKGHITFRIDMKSALLLLPTYHYSKNID